MKKAMQRKVLIDYHTLIDLMKDSLLLNSLEGKGVDNWGGYCHDQEEMKEMLNDYGAKEEAVKQLLKDQECESIEELDDIGWEDVAEVLLSDVKDSFIVGVYKN